MPLPDAASVRTDASTASSFDDMVPAREDDGQVVAHPGGSCEREEEYGAPLGLLRS